MSIRIRSAQFLLLMVFFAIAGSLFLFGVGQDALAERNSFQFFADSNTYHLMYAENALQFDGSLVSLKDNFVGPSLVLQTAMGSAYLVLLLNVLIFSYSVVRITALLDLDPLKVGMLLLLSPLTVSSLLAVNKEIFFFPFLTFVLVGYLEKSAMAIVVALLLSILVRWQLTAFYVLLLLMSATVGVHRGRTALLMGVLMAASAFYVLMQDWLEPIIAVVQLSIQVDEDPGTGLFEALLRYQREGLYFIVFPIKALHLLFGLGVRLDRLLNPGNFYNDVFVVLHCAATLLVVCGVLAHRAFSIRSDLIFASLIFLAVFCLSPIFSPRYLYPVFVLWVLVFAGAPANLQTVRGNRPRYNPATNPKAIANNH